jgi:hypothetical protein
MLISDLKEYFRKRNGKKLDPENRSFCRLLGKTVNPHLPLFGPLFLKFFCRSEIRFWWNGLFLFRETWNKRNKATFSLNIKTTENSKTAKYWYISTGILQRFFLELKILLCQLLYVFVQCSAAKKTWRTQMLLLHWNCGQTSLLPHSIFHPCIP